MLLSSILKKKIRILKRFVVASGCREQERRGKQAKHTEFLEP